MYALLCLALVLFVPLATVATVVVGYLVLVRLLLGA